MPKKSAPGVTRHPILDAAYAGNLDIMERFLKDSPSLANLQGADGSAPLHIAADMDNTKMIDLLARYNANLEVRDRDGNTPLHRAAMHDHLEAFARLMELGANIEARNKGLHTPIETADLYYSTEIVRYLQKRGLISRNE